MPLKSLSQCSFFDPEFVCPSILEEGTVAWLLGRFRSKLFPSWLLKGWRGEGKVGRNAWPAVVLISLWLLRWSGEGMSRLAAVKQASTNLQWRAAMGLACDVSPPSEKTMRDFEKFLAQRHPEVDVPRYLLVHEHVVRLCTEHGVVGKDPLWAADSTPMWCYGAVLDTVRLLGDGLRQLGQSWAQGTRCSLEEVAEQWKLSLLLAKSTKGWLGVDWRDRDARADAVDQLAGHVLRIVTWVRKRLPEVRPGLRKRLLRQCRDLVRIVRDNLEADDQGRLVVAQRVARDRLISLTDPQARHGRKSAKRLFNGFKFHVVGDLVSGLIASVTVTVGNQHDAVPAHRLVRRAKDLFDEIRQVLADTAYGGARTRHEIKQTLDVDLLTPPQPETLSRSGKLNKSDFTIDFESATVTCPGGNSSSELKVVHDTEHDLPTRRYRWDKQDCDACPLRDACLDKDRRTRTFTLHPFEQELRAQREAWQQPEVRALYRRRGEFERLINTVARHGGRQARTWGLTAANAQAHAIVTTNNLLLLAQTLAAAERPPDTFALAA